MRSKIISSRLGLNERASDSVQPVHSWNDSQITDWRRAWAKLSAIVAAAAGGSAISEAM